MPLRRSTLWSDPRVKPPFGAAELDWGHPLARGLLSAWLITEGGGGQIRDVCQRHTGVLAAPVWGAGARGLMLAFNGTSSSASFPSFTASGGAFTFVASIYDTFTGDPSAIFDCGGSDRLALSANGGNWAGTNKALSIFDGVGVLNLGSTNSIPTATWASVAVTLSSVANASIGYVNGVATGTSTSFTATLTGGAALGSRWSLDTLFWLGQLRHAAFYTRVLSAGEVLWLASEPYAMMRPVVRRRLSVAAAVGGAANPPYTPMRQLVPIFAQ